MQYDPSTWPLVPDWAAFDALATLVAVLQADGSLCFANAALEDALGLSRRSLVGSEFATCFTDPDMLRQALQGLSRNEFASLHCDAWLKRHDDAPMPVHVIVTPSAGAQTVVELLPQLRQTRQEREERLIAQALAHKELIRNLAHEIKNPLGGIRGAAQLLQMEVESKDLHEYAQVIIHEADRLHALVDRLLAPQQYPPILGDVNIHEVCERVRALILAEFPRGLRLVRDYDSSIPEFQGNREQLIQAVLNIARNAAQALAAQIAQGNAEMVFKTRVLRQITLGRQRHRLALRLHVIDNGPGVPDSIRERIFAPLVSGRDGGSGLGLTVAQSLVRQHHGLIEYESRPGRTDFSLLIPLA